MRIQQLDQRIKEEEQRTEMQQRYRMEAERHMTQERQKQLPIENKSTK